MLISYSLKKPRKGHQTSFPKVRPIKPENAEPGWTVDKNVSTTKVTKSSTRQMTAVVQVMRESEGVPLTFRQIWESAQKIHHVGDRTVREHLARMVKEREVIRLEGPAFSPLYVLRGYKVRQWFRCHECAQVISSQKDIPDEIDVGTVEGSYLWGVCRECTASGVEVVKAGSGSRWPIKASGGERRKWTYPEETPQ